MLPEVAIPCRDSRQGSAGWQSGSATHAEAFMVCYRGRNVANTDICLPSDAKKYCRDASTEKMLLIRIRITSIGTGAVKLSNERSNGATTKRSQPSSSWNTKAQKDRPARLKLHTLQPCEGWYLCLEGALKWRGVTDLFEDFKNCLEVIGLCGVGEK